MTDLYEPEFIDLIVVDFSNVAQGCYSYPEFVGRMSRTLEDDLQYMGLGI